MKIDRLLAIVMILLNRNQANAKELADYFEVSQRTIYRDIEAINQAGIPIVSYMGSDGGFSIMENYQISKNFLTSEEISSILAALKGINTTIGNRKVSNTFEKIKGMLKDNEPSSSKAKSFPIHIDYSSWSSSAADKDKLKTINKAIDEKRVIGFNYINIRGEEAYRLVEPLSLILKDFSWFLHGYCHMKNDYRLFKIKRMNKIDLTKDFFTREFLPVEELSYMDEWSGDKPQLAIVLKFSANAKVRVVDCFHYDQIQFNVDGTCIVSFTFPEDEWLMELILGFGSSVEVLEPVHLRQVIKEKALEIAKIY